MRVYLPQMDETYEFYQAADGWWECEDINRAINPAGTSCIMDPYEDSMGGDPPQFDFEILEG